MIIGFVALLLAYKNLYYFKHLKTDNFKVLSEFKSDQIVGLHGRQILVHENFIPYLNDIDQYAKANDITIIVNHSYRYHKQKLSKTVVTPSKFSNHLAGFAIDFNLKYKGKKYLAKDLKRSNLKKLPKNIQNFLNKIMSHKQLRWGGNFNTPDPVHIDFPLNINNRKKWNQLNQLCRLDFSTAIPKWNFWK